MRLTEAGLPLAAQVALGVGLVAGYWVWSRAYYRLLDPALRGAVGRMLGVPIAWVLRHDASYETPFEMVRTPYRRWTWGIPDVTRRTFLRDGAVAFLSLLLVNVLAGVWPAALFLYLFLGPQLLSYVVFLPACLAVIGIYSTFWSGRYEVPGMRS